MQALEKRKSMMKRMNKEHLAQPIEQRTLKRIKN